MTVIDSDAHIVECDETWSYLDPSDRQYRPVRVAETDANGEPKEYWLIDGNIFPAGRPGLGQARVGPHTDKVLTPDESKYLTDVSARIRHMDELGTDVQILFPTIFINPVTEDPAMERALCKSYNRCLADIWSQSNNRLRWAAVLPLLSMDVAMEELRTARMNGACAVIMRGIESENRLIIDPYFHRLYAEASDLDMPICVHTGNGSTDIMSIFPSGYGFPRFKLIGVGAFQVVCESRLPDQFPNLRWGFIELSAQWIPYVIKDLSRRFERRDIQMKENILRDNHIWVTCQTNDDLDYIMSYVGDDNLVIGTDYGHADTSTEVYALKNLSEVAGLSQESARKFLDDNARALYGL